MRIKRALRALTFGVALAASSLVVSASPAAAVQDYACAPSATTWTVVGAWDDGSVMEARACLQWDGGNKSRVKSEFRARKGGVALSGTDWDADSVDDGRAWDRAIFDVYDPNNIAHGPSSAGGDIFNASYVVRYSNWYCFTGGQQMTIFGLGWDIRATPPGLPRSGYHSGQTDNATTYLATC